MTIIDDRACTELHNTGQTNEDVSVTRRLSEMRSAPAYVLLGDPGLGKSTAFCSECRAEGETAILLDARDFLALELDSHPEWRGKTLFIDGLDEVRAGARDARTALDEIRGRLDALGQPRFRISCREADWLGDNDRRRLAQVSPSSEVRVLHLNPLSDDEIERILQGHPLISDPRAFVLGARQRRLGGLLANPQTLSMLGDVAGGGADWPANRGETFDRACRAMATESNEEFALGGRPRSLDEVMHAAGHLCAAQLMTGAAGCSLHPDELDPAYLQLDSLGDPQSNGTRAAVATRLFRSIGERRFTPIHRHVAEFLSARYLSHRIDGELSPRRIVSQISGADATVVAELRGLSGWLAALCPETRDLLITRDPVGVALYGDLSGFTDSERRKLLSAMSNRGALTRMGFDARAPETVAMLAPLTASDMEPTIAGILMGRLHDPEHQRLAEFVLSLLARGAPLPSLAPQLLRIARDESHGQYVRSFAVDALIRSKREPGQRTAELESLLDEIRAGAISDPDSEMKGALLTYLYPSEITPRRVWDYLTERANRHFVGRDSVFWCQRILEQSTDQDVAILLDELATRATDVKAALDSHPFALLTRLLARGLTTHGDDLPIPRLYAWLSGVMPEFWRGQLTQDDSVADVREWLERRPEIQKAIMGHGLSLWPDAEHPIEAQQGVFGPLLGSSLPVDFGSWCLEEAVPAAASQPDASLFLLKHAFQACQAGELPIDLLKTSVAGIQPLEEWLSERLQPPMEPQRTQVSERRAAREARRDEEQQRRFEYVREHVRALRENRAPLRLLHDLGQAYFDFPASSTRPLAPVDRVAVYVGGNRDLVQAALAGLRESPWRTDLPEPKEIIRLSEQSRLHFLSFPVQAAMDLLQEEGTDRLMELSEHQARAALTFYYCAPASFAQEPAWHVTWAKHQPEIVAAVAAETAISALRRKDGHSQALYALADVGGPPELKRRALLGVLSRFPLRARLESLRTLDFLLWNLLAQPDRAALLRLIDSRLSGTSMGVAQRVHWLAAGVVAAPERYTDQMRVFVRHGQRRVRHLADFFDAGDPSESNGRELNPATLQVLIELMAPAFGPESLMESGFYTLEMKASSQIERFIRQLGTIPSEDASQALAALIEEKGLGKWSNFIERVRDDQRVLHREATYTHPDLEQLRRVLDDGAPANAADLAALILDRLAHIATEIGSSNAELWRHFWNENAYGQPESPKHEDSCRDALLAQLRRYLPRPVDAQPEGQYVGDKRSDIRVACADFNVPIEIKKVTHRDLWSAMQSQLINSYIRDPATSGYGIYLVLWFAGAEMPPPPEGTRPTRPSEMQERLQQSLAADDALKVNAVVLDVSPPS